MATIRIPTPLRGSTGGNALVTVTGDNVAEALADLTRQYPELRGHLFDGDQLRSFVNLYLGQDDIRYLNGQATPVGATDTLLIVPSIAGGAA